MSAPIQLQDLVSEIAHSYPDAKFELDPLSSGVCILTVTLNGREFVIDYNPKRRTGVSENFHDTPPFVGHDEVFETLDAGVNRFKAFLADAALHESAVSRTAFVLHDKPISK